MLLRDVIKAVEIGTFVVIHTVGGERLAGRKHCDPHGLGTAWNVWLLTDDQLTVIDGHRITAIDFPVSAWNPRTNHD